MIIQLHVPTIGLELQDIELAVMIEVLESHTGFEDFLVIGNECAFYDANL